MDARGFGAHHAGVRVLAHVKKLDDALAHFRIRIICRCGAQRECEPQALVNLVGPSATLEAIGRRMRCSKCGAKGAEIVAIAIERPRGRGLLLSAYRVRL